MSPLSMPLINLTRSLDRSNAFFTMRTPRSLQGHQRVWRPALWRRVVVISCLLTCGAAVAEAASPRIAGLQRVAADGKGAETDGRILLTELNCASCHRSATIGAKPAPSLENITGRIKWRHLAKSIADPGSAKPGATMPRLPGLAADPRERNRQSEALVQFLASRGDRAPPQQFSTTGARERGRMLFHQVGCAACHDRRGADGAVEGDSLSTSALLPDLASKYTLPTLKAFLRNPHETRPGGRMPSLALASDEAEDIAAFLLQTAELSRIRVSYFEGSWDRLPDFSALTPKSRSNAERIDVSPRRRDNQFGLRFEGRLHIEREGEYTFYVGADDGARLAVDGFEVVGNDGVHPYTVKSGKRTLSPGWRHLVVDYFEAAGEERLTVEFEGPGVKRQPLDQSLAGITEPPKLESLDIELDLELAAQGAELFRAANCAACHPPLKPLAGSEPVGPAELGEQGGALAPPLEQLRGDRGCLAERPATNVPDYSLAPEQRAALRAALSDLAAQKSLGDAEQVRATLIRFNCLACHQRGELGGVEAAREELFQTPVREMGDEGRIPPTLDGVGAKLTALWFDKIFSQGAVDRPYMLTRMPKFGAENLAHLPPLLEAVDAVEPLPATPLSEAAEAAKEHGRRMAGVRGFSCTQCHSFGRFRARGIQSIDMRTMTQRLREDWFRRYLRNPQVYRPRTRMPSPWPPSGPSLLRDVLEGDSDQQIAALWLYLNDGPRAKIPDGLVTESMELVPIDQAILYRNFIEGAGPRAIGVGYPEGVHLAFDADQLRLALTWEGRFIDASRHWSGRGQGFEPPAGEHVVSYSSGPEWAHLPSLDAPWPERSGRFGGYRVDEENRPTFLLRYGSRRLEATFDTKPLDAKAADGSPAPLRRLLSLSASDPDAPAAPEPASERLLVWRVATGAEIRPLADGWYEVDGRWKTRVRGPSANQLVQRESQGRQELLLTAPLEAAQWRQEFRW